MSEQDLDDADVHALLEHVRGETVSKRVRPKPLVEAALVSRFVEGESCGCIRHVRDDATTGKQPFPTAVCLPDRPQHIQNRLGQRQRPFFVSLADHTQHHLLRVDRRDRQRDRFADSQAVGVDERKTAAIDRLFQRGDQAAAICVATDIGQPLLARLTDFFLVQSAQS